MTEHMAPPSQPSAAIVTGWDTIVGRQNLDSMMDALTRIPDDQTRFALAFLLGALSGHVTTEAWDEALSTMLAEWSKR